MATKIGWGKPAIETRILTEDEGFASDWVLLNGIVKDSAILTTELATKLNASEESGGVLDSKTGTSKYIFEFELYKTKGATKPIPDIDGIVEQEYAIRLTPEDPKNAGWLIRRSSVSVEDTWAAKIGHKWKYTFEALKPDTGKLLEPAYNEIRAVRFLSGFRVRFIQSVFRLLK